jgi:hypothetical protein
MFFWGSSSIEGGGGGVRGIFEKKFCRRFERNCGELLFRMSGIQA